MISIRKLRHWKTADSGVLREMDTKCFPKDLTFWNDEDTRWWIVYVDGVPAAYAGARISARTGDGKQVKVVKFTRCGVLPEFRGRGFQADLIKARLSWAKRVKAEIVKTYTHKDNKHSMNNLLAAGFKSRKRGRSDYIDFRKDLR